MSFLKLTASAVAIAAVSAPAFARDNVQVAGSSTVLPYASIVAEALVRTSISQHLLLNPAAHQRA